MNHFQSRREALKTLALAAPVAFGAVPPGLASAGGASEPKVDLTLVHGTDIRAATRTAIAVLGGIRSFVSRGNVVFVKPSIGFPRTPAQGANTHPDVVAAIVELCLDAGAKLVRVGDHTLDRADRCYQRSGIQAAAERAGARVDFVGAEKFRRMDLKGELVKEWEVYVDLVEADTLINVPVAKHHSLSRMTGAMKNWFGGIGGARDRLHAQIDIAIADLAQFFRPALTILDASRLMIRNGPQGGSLADVRQTDIVAASTDQVAIDAVTASLLQLVPRDVGFITTAHDRGLGTMDLDRLVVARREL